MTQISIFHLVDTLEINVRNTVRFRIWQRAPRDAAVEPHVHYVVALPEINQITVMPHKKSEV